MGLAVPSQPAPEAGDAASATGLLTETYTQLRQLAAARLAHEKPNQTLQATALVHEAWLRIAGAHAHSWNNRAEFFAAAAQAMRRILVENARRKKRRENLEGGQRVPLEYVEVTSPLPDEELLALDEGLHELANHHSMAARVVELRFFTGLTQTEAAQQLGISRSTADRLWLLARSWLYARIRMPEPVGCALRCAPPATERSGTGNANTTSDGAQRSAHPT